MKVGYQSLDGIKILCHCCDCLVLTPIKEDKVTPHGNAAFIETNQHLVHQTTETANTHDILFDKRISLLPNDVLDGG